MDSSPDRDLVERTRRGEVNAYGELVRRYQTSVFNVCYRMMGEHQEAEDLAKVAANLCLNSLQKRAPVRLTLDEEHDDPIDVEQPDPAVAHDRADQSQRLRRALQELPPHYRAVIELRHYQDLSYEEMAQTLKVSLSDVKSHLFRARRLLARRLGGRQGKAEHAS